MPVIEWNRCSDFAQGQYARQTVGIISWCRYTKNFSDSWDDSVWTVWFETPDAILIAIRRFEELNLYLLGYDFENYQVSFHQEINRCTKIVTPTSDMKIHMECMREELSVIKPVILLKALLFDLAARRTKCSFGIVQGFHYWSHVWKTRLMCTLSKEHTNA